MAKTPTKGSKLPPEVLEFFKKAGAEGGRIGGKLGAAIVNERLSPEERSERARKAVAAREAKRAAAESSEGPKKATAKKRVSAKARV